MVVNKFLLMKFKVLLLQSLPISQPDIILLYSERRVFAVFFSHEIVASHHLLSPPTAPILMLMLREQRVGKVLRRD